MARRLRDLIVELRDVSDASAFLQGGCLVRLEYDRLYQKTDEGEGIDWPTFVEDVIGIGLRRAQYLMAIYSKSIELGITAETVEEIGPAKMREILTVATRENVERWLVTARKETFRDVAARVKVARRQVRESGGPRRRIPEPDDEEPARWSLLLTPPQRRNIEDALRLARTEAKLKNIPDAALMDLIVTDWRANRLPRDRSIRWHVRQLERAYRIKLRVVDE